MKMIGSHAHSELIETIRAYSMDDGAFDFDSVVELVLAGVDNLVENATAADFEENTRLSKEQADMLRHLFLRLMPEE